MADLYKVKSNVKRMIDSGSKRQEIDSYLYSEGVSLDELRNFRLEEPKVKEKTSLWDYSSIGKSENDNPLVSGIKKVEREALTPGLHFANQFALNYPRSALNKAGIEYPEAETGLGNAITKTGGALGAITNPLSKFIVGKMSRIPGTGTAISKYGDTVGKNIAKAAGWGAIDGVAYAPTEDIVGIKDRITNALTGSALGGVFTGASALAKGTVTGFRKFKNPSVEFRKEHPNVKVGMSPLERMQGLKQGVLKEKEKLTREISEEMFKVKVANQHATNVISDNIQILKSQLDTASEKGAINVQEMLPDFFKANSEAYGARLDEAVGAIKDYDSNVGREIIQTTLDELGEMGVESGSIYKMLTNALGKDNAPKEIPFGDLNNLRKSIWKSVSSGLKKGQRFAEEDISCAIFQKNFGQFVADNAPEFAELQKAYAPVVQGMKELGRHFKPYVGEFTNISGGSGLLKRAGTGELTPQESNLVSLMEGGSEFAKGLGPVTKEVKRLGGEISSAKTGNILQHRMAQQARDKLTERKFTELQLIEKRIEQLEKQGDKVRLLVERKRHADAIRHIIGKTLFWTAIGTGTYNSLRAVGGMTK